MELRVGYVQRIESELADKDEQLTRPQVEVRALRLQLTATDREEQQRSRSGILHSLEDRGRVENVEGGRWVTTDGS